MTERALSEQDSLVSELAAAQFMGISVRTLQAWRMKDAGPPFVRLGRAIRYRWSTLIEWIKSNTHSPCNRS